MKTKERIIGLRELRENTSTYITRVGRGESFVVLQRSKPVFRLSSPEASDDNDEWETIIDLTKIKKGGIPARELLRHLKKFNG